MRNSAWGLLYLAERTAPPISAHPIAFPDSPSNGLSGIEAMLPGRFHQGMPGVASRGQPNLGPGYSGMARADAFRGHDRPLNRTEIGHRRKPGQRVADGTRGSVEARWDSWINDIFNHLEIRNNRIIANKGRNF
jgi:hypothetical protein